MSSSKFCVILLVYHHYTLSTAQVDGNVRDHKVIQLNLKRTWMPAPHLRAIHTISGETFQSKSTSWRREKKSQRINKVWEPWTLAQTFLLNEWMKLWPTGGTRWKVRGSSKSMRFILLGKLMHFGNFANHPTAGGLFQFSLERWLERPTNLVSLSD